MSDAFATLLGLCNPPELPVGLDYQWSYVEPHFNTVFPVDVKAIISLYGSGKFLPSEMRLCNYLNSHFCEYDIAFNAARRCLDRCKVETASQQVFLSGLLPLALEADDFIWFVKTQESGWNLISLSLSDGTFAQMNWPGMAKFLVHSFATGYSDEANTPPSYQHFQKSANRSLIDTNVCKLVALGGGLQSYAIGRSIVARITDKASLTDARQNISEASIFVHWEWKDPMLPIISAPSCSFSFEFEDSSNQLSSSQERRDQSKARLTDRADLKVGMLETGDAEVYWLQVSDVRINSLFKVPSAIKLEFYGELVTVFWQLFVTVSPSHLEEFYERAVAFCSSIRYAKHS